ncbi:MAG: ROK family protein [Holophagales bacterium]|jgi:glucokinase|nr:ROK family protein [Holophagales bacterium]
MTSINSDSSHTILTLDAGGTNFEFRAIRNQKDAAPPVVLPSRSENLDTCLKNITGAFQRLKEAVGGTIHAISFAFPGPADYDNGIIGDLQNLPCFRGGVPLGPILEEQFKVPVFINNDGDLFAYGEALYGLLPEVNAELAATGSPKRFKNLLGLTFGTGFGAGIASDGRLFLGDNSAAAEIWCIRNKLDRESYAEEGVSIRAVRLAYAEKTGQNIESVPEPIDIAAIADGKLPGNMEAAKYAFRRMGEVAGDAVANAVTMIDGLVVIGGGITGAWRLFLPTMVDEMNRELTSVTGRGIVPRTELTVFNLEDEEQWSLFIRGQTSEIQIPGTRRTVLYDTQKRVGVAISKLGAPRAVSLGAYAYALANLNV